MKRRCQKDHRDTGLRPVPVRVELSDKFVLPGTNHRLEVRVTVTSLILVMICVTVVRRAPAAEPEFCPNVLVFDPSMPDNQKRVDAVFATQECGEFNPHRYAYLFKPEKYSLDVQLGYYIQAMGLGQLPDDVVISGAVRPKAAWNRGNSAIISGGRWRFGGFPGSGITHILNGQGGDAISHKSARMN